MTPPSTLASVARNTHLDIPRTTSSIVARAGGVADEHDDRLNYCLLLALYTLQGIPMVRILFFAVIFLGAAAFLLW